MIDIGSIEYAAVKIFGFFTDPRERSWLFALFVSSCFSFDQHAISMLCPFSLRTNSNRIPLREFDLSSVLLFLSSSVLEAWMQSGKGK